MRTELKKTLTLRGLAATAVAVAALGLAGVSITVASEASDAPTYSLDIPAQSLSDALQALALTSRHRLIYSSAVVDGRSAPAVKGEFTAAQAVERLLAGTGLSFEITADGLVVIREKGAQRAEQELAGARAMRLAQAEGSSRAPGGGASPDTSTGGAEQAANLENTATAANLKKEEEQDPERAGIPEILVTGSKLGTLNMDIRRSADDVQPYIVFDRGVIERASVSTIDAFLKQQLAMNTVFNSNDQLASELGNASSVNLRGLGSNQTLILVDGRRLASFNVGGGSQQSDINGIPLSAVERIEILPTSASAIYGGSATGGVVNVILRRDYAGLDAGVTYGNTFDSNAENRRVDFNAGVGLEDGRTSILLSGSYSESDPLSVRERNFVQKGRAAIIESNPGTFLDATLPPLGQTTNIRSATGEPLTLTNGISLNSPITFVPVGYAGIQADGGTALANNAGQYNLDLANTAQDGGGANRDLLNGPTVESLIATVRREFTPRLDAFLDLSASNNFGALNRNLGSSTFTIRRGQPNNPFQQDIVVTTPAFGLDGTISSSIRTRRAVSGVIFGLGGDWQGEADYSWNRVEFSSYTPGGLSSAARTAVSNGAIDVLRDTTAFPTDFSPFWAGPTLYRPADVTMRNWTARFAGPLFKVAGGPVTLSALLERRDELLGNQVLVLPSFEVLYPRRSQAVESAYVELNAPLVTNRIKTRGVHELTLQVAARWDNYRTRAANEIVSVDPRPVENFTNRFDSVDPLVGLRYKPTSHVMLRTSYGTGFLPPALSQLVTLAPFTVPGFNVFGLRDPLRGNEPVGDITVYSGGNPDLRPEQSKSWSAGLVLTPKQIPGLRLSADWTSIRKTDNIRNVATLSQFDFDNEASVPGLIIREPASPGDSFGVGRTIGINQGLFNVARTHVEAYDFSLGYEFPTAYGKFDFSVATTRHMHFKTQFTPLSPILEEAGVIGGSGGVNLAWKGNIMLVWSNDKWTLSWASKYFDEYRFFVTSPTVPDQLYHDFFASYRIRQDSGVLSDSEIQIGIKNIFNKEPPLNLEFRGGTFYSPLADPRLASYTVSIRKSFGQ